MSDYGFYLWGSYGMTVLCICLEILFLRSKKAKA